jgi:hypothetical protein
MRQSITKAAIKRIQARRSAPVPPEEISMSASKWNKPEPTNEKPELTRKRKKQEIDIHQQPRKLEYVRAKAKKCPGEGVHTLGPCSIAATQLPECAWTIIIPFLSTQGRSFLSWRGTTQHQYHKSSLQ